MIGYYHSYGWLWRWVNLLVAALSPVWEKPKTLTHNILVNYQTLFLFICTRHSYYTHFFMTIDWQFGIQQISCRSHVMNRSCLFEVYGQTEKYIYHVELSKTQRWPNGIKRQQHWRLVDRHTMHEL